MFRTVGNSVNNEIVIQRSWKSYHFNVLWGILVIVACAFESPFRRLFKKKMWRAFGLCAYLYHQLHWYGCQIFSFSCLDIYFVILLFFYLALIEFLLFLLYPKSIKINLMAFYNGGFSWSFSLVDYKRWKSC